VVREEGVVRVLVVDDQAVVRMGLATLIAAEDGLELVGEAADGRAGLSMIRAIRPDVVLCDIRMPVLDGLALLREVASDAGLSDVRVVMLTTFELDEYVFEALRLGASGFLLKDIQPVELVEDVERRCVEREVVDERRQTDRLVEVDVVVGTDLLVVQLPEGHELFVATDLRIGREEEVLGPAAVLARSGGDHDLDELEAHQLGVEAIRGSRIACGKGNMMERHC